VSLACLGLALIAAAGRPHPPVSLQTYRAQIHAARVALDRAVRFPGDRRDLSTAARLLSLSTRVTIPGAGTISTDSAARASQLLRFSGSSTGEVAAWADRLDDSLRRTAIRPVSTRDLRVLDSVLRDPRFHPVQPPWERFQEWLRSLYQRFLRLLNSAMRPGTPSSLVSAVLLLALVAGVAVLLARGAMGKLIVERSAEEERRQPSTPESAERRAAESAAAGDYRQALRYLFLSTLLQLQARGLVELRPGMTNREYLGRYQSGRPHGGSTDESFRRLVDVFDAVWYGHAPIDAEGYASARETAGQALQAVPERAA
jgi:hypothetical protein